MHRIYGQLMFTSSRAGSLCIIWSFALRGVLTVVLRAYSCNKLAKPLPDTVSLIVHPAGDVDPSTTSSPSIFWDLAVLFKNLAIATPAAVCTDKAVI